MFSRLAADQGQLAKSEKQAADMTERVVAQAGIARAIPPVAVAVGRPTAINLERAVAKVPTRDPVDPLTGKRSIKEEQLVPHSCRLLSLVSLAEEALVYTWKKPILPADPSNPNDVVGIFSESAKIASGGHALAVAVGPTRLSACSSTIDSLSGRSAYLDSRFGRLAIAGQPASKKFRRNVATIVG